MLMLARCQVDRPFRRRQAGVNSRTVVLAAVIAAAGGAAAAHHSISSIYDNRRPVTIEGAVAQFHLIYPHPYLLIDVGNDAEAGRWRGEMDNRGELAAIGVTADTFRPGDRVVVRGSLARTEPQSLYVLRLDRPADGFWYEQVGATPRIGGPSR